jgi:ribosomal-protein-alanine N-acetyltransferase
MRDTQNLVFTTTRLSVERMTLDAAPFVLGLVNEAPFRRFIGDKGVRNVDDARRYIREVPLADYEDHGYGGYLVRLTGAGTPIGICGLYKRANLRDPDLGFAFAEAWCGRGLAREAAAGVIRYGRDELHLREMVALVDPANQRSRHLIEVLGFEKSGTYRMPDETEDLYFYRLSIDPAMPGRAPG